MEARALFRHLLLFSALTLAPLRGADADPASFCDPERALLALVGEPGPHPELTHASVKANRAHAKKWVPAALEHDSRFTIGAVSAKTSGEPFIAGNLGDLIVTFYDGHLYFSHFHYRTKAAPYALHPRISWAKLEENQPYLKWTEDHYEYAAGKAGSQILESMIRGRKEIVLYRGTSRKELDHLRTLSRKSPADLIEHFRDPKTTAQNTYAATFFSPQVEGARGWANPLIVEYRIPAEEFRELHRRGGIYLGVEDNYIEVGIRNPEAMASYARSVRVHSTIEP